MFSIKNFNLKIDILDGIREYFTGQTDCLNCGKWFDVPKDYSVECENDQSEYEFCSIECQNQYETNSRAGM